MSESTVRAIESAVGLPQEVPSSRQAIASAAFARIARKLFDKCCEMTGATSGYVALLTPDGRENNVVFLEAGGCHAPSTPLFRCRSVDCAREPTT